MRRTALNNFFIITSLFFLSATVFSSCEKEEDAGVGEKVDAVFRDEITFSAETSGSKAAAIGRNIEPVTVMPETIEVAMMKGKTIVWGSKSNDHNEQFSKSGSVYTAGRYWPDDASSRYTFYASNVPMTVNTNGATISVTGAEPISKDIIVATAFSERTSDAVGLDFKHIFSRIGTVSFDQEGCELNFVRVNGCYTTGTYTLGSDSGWSNEDNEKKIVIQDVEDDTDYWFIPGEYNIDLDFFDAQGTEFTYSVSHEFEEGEVYDINCKLGAHGEVIIGQGTDYEAPNFTVSIGTVPAFGGKTPEPVLKDVKERSRQKYSHPGMGDTYGGWGKYVTLKKSEYTVEYSRDGKTWKTKFDDVSYEGDNLGTTTYPSGVFLGLVYVRVTSINSEKSSVKVVNSMQDPNNKKYDIPTVELSYNNGNDITYNSTTSLSPKLTVKQLVKYDSGAEDPPTVMPYTVIGYEAAADTTETGAWFNLNSKNGILTPDSNKGASSGQKVDYVSINISKFSYTTAEAGGGKSEPSISGRVTRRTYSEGRYPTDDRSLSVTVKVKANGVEGYGSCVVTQEGDLGTEGSVVFQKEVDLTSDILKKLTVSYETITENTFATLDKETGVVTWGENTTTVVRTEKEQVTITGDDGVSRTATADSRQEGKEEEWGFGGGGSGSGGGESGNL